MSASAHPPLGPPTESAWHLFCRFLRFGLLAWGGPVAQIDMIRQQLVTQERWITNDQFRRLLAIYQVLPGPEAHELCVHFGMMARGRWGGVLAGLGFMLPGFVLMFALSWAYLRFNLTSTAFQAVFLGIQPVVIALIVRACHRIGAHALVDPALWVIAGFAAVGELLRVPFWVTLSLSGLGYVAAGGRRWFICALVALAFAIGTVAWSPVIRGDEPILPRGREPAADVQRDVGQAAPAALLTSGLRAGLLTFGGAYTAIPFLERDAVERGQWMTRADFLDGVALSGILPAPLIIFSTFVGYFGGGAWGALAMTIGVFLPAFSFTLLFYRHLEAVIANVRLRRFLEGVTAGVVGLIVVTVLGLAATVLVRWQAWLICGSALIVLYRWKSRAVVPTIIAVGGLLGILLLR